MEGERSVKVTTTDILKEFLWPRETVLRSSKPQLGPRRPTIRTTDDEHFWFSSRTFEILKKSEITDLGEKFGSNRTELKT